MFTRFGFNRAKCPVSPFAQVSIRIDVKVLSNHCATVSAFCVRLATLAPHMPMLTAYVFPTSRRRDAAQPTSAVKQISTNANAMQVLPSNRYPRIPRAWSSCDPTTCVLDPHFAERVTVQFLENL